MASVGADGSGKNGVEDVSVDAVYEQVRVALGSEATTVERSGVVEIVPGIRTLALRTPTLPPATHTACFLVGPSGPRRGAVMVVDPASPYADEQAALDDVLAAEAEAGRPVAAIWLTHHHGDHVGGAAHLAARLGVPVWAHAATAERLAGSVPVHRHLEDGDELEVDGRAVIAVHTPGHAPGHLCFFDRSSGAVIAGDMVAGVGTILIDPSEGDMAEYLGSLERLIALAPARLLPAHGPVIEDAIARLRGYIAHRQMREQRIAAALARAGHAVTARELVPDAYADTPRALWLLAERSLLSHLVKLERDGRARRQPDGWVAV